MLSYCLKCRKNTESKNPNIGKTKNKKIMLDSIKSKFIKQQKASGLLSSLGIKTPSNKIPLLDPLLF